MTEGIKALRKIQIGIESTAGTAVAASTIWRGTGGMPDDQSETVFPEEDIGYLSGVTRAYIPKYTAVAAFDDTPATFEQLPIILEAGVKTVAPTTDTGSGIIRTYALPTTAVNTIKTRTIEAGDNNAVEEMAYSFVTDFAMTGNAGEAWMVSANWQGRQWAPSSFTSDLTPVAVEEMLFSKSLLYIDDTSDTIGTSDNLISNTLLSATLNVTTGQQAVWTSDGQLYFSFVKNVMPEVTLELTYEHNATATAEKAKWRANTPRQVRLACSGSALTSGGTYTTKTMIIDVVGLYESFAALEDTDGNDTVTCTLRGRYDLTAAKFATIIVVNQVAALP